MLNIVVERGYTRTLSQMPKKSIALDGFVQGPEIDLDNERISFDHHDKVIRTFTRATCQQVMDAILLGFDPEGYTVYINDVDGDTVLACWLLQNPRLAVRTYIRGLVEAVGAVDAHGPAYPLIEGDMLAEIFYHGVMTPVSDAHKNKTYSTCDLEALLLICMQRLDDMVDGETFGVDEADNPLPVHYSISHEGKGWAMVYSDGAVFSTLYEDGINAAIAYSLGFDGTWGYTVAKKSEFVNFPVGPVSKPGTILHMLSKVEPGWGGGSSIGGAPRHPDGKRSSLPPTRVFELVCELLGDKESIRALHGETENIGPETSDIPEMLSDEFLQAARASAAEALAEENS